MILFGFGGNVGFFGLIGGVFFLDTVLGLSSTISFVLANALKLFSVVSKVNNVVSEPTEIFLDGNLGLSFIPLSEFAIGIEPVESVESVDPICFGNFRFGPFALVLLGWVSFVDTFVD